MAAVTEATCLNNSNKEELYEGFFFVVFLVKTTCRLAFCYQRYKDNFPHEGRKCIFIRNVNNHLQTVTVEFAVDLGSGLLWGKTAVLCL
jgi:hypothetical protein